MGNPNPEFWMTVDDVAAELGKDPETIKKAILAGQIPSYRVGIMSYIPLKAWEEFRAGRWTPRPQAMSAAPTQMFKRRAS